jgi:hypothetical protein
LKWRSKLRLRAAVVTAFLPILLAGSLSGCAHSGPPGPGSTAPTLQGDAAHPDKTQGWVGTRLYFGLGPADHPEQGISETKWREFLDREVSPRFPDGLTVLDVYGQWLGKGQTILERLHTKMLVIYYPDVPENRTNIEAIRAAWKKMTGHQSVLRVTEPADVSF